MKLTVAVKLWIAVVVAILAIVAQAALARAWLDSLYEREDQEQSAIDTALRAVVRWVSLTEANATRVQATLITSDSALDAAFKDPISGAQTEILQAQRIVEGMELTGEDRKTLDKVLALNKTANESLARLRKHRADFQLDAAREESEKVYFPAVKDYLLQLRNFAGTLEARAGASRQEAGAARDRANRIVFGALALILAGLAVGAALLIRSIRRPLLEAVAGAEHIAQGDLQGRLAQTRSDEFGDLMRALQGTVAELNRMVGAIKATSDAVGTAAGEIAEGHADLSTRTEEQASSLEETAATMEQMTATVAQNAENARKASKRASEASAVAERGGEAVAAVVTTMDGIAQSSRKIADITGVIDGIAFQTNILALNAAVEAARAGEQGRGFAVVAAEVRSLAQRSAAAAKEIRQLTADSVGRVDAGARQVAQAGETMAEIVATIRRVNKRVAEISAASQEQSQSLAQVSDTVAQLEKVTQQNAAMVEEASAASDSLKEQAATLARAVGGFRLAAEAKTHAAPAPVRVMPAAVPKSAPGTALPGQPRPASAGELKAPPRKAKDKAGEGWEEF